MSPLMSITRAPSEGERTWNVVAASGMGSPFRADYGDILVVSDPHEVGQPGDLEDLPVVLGKAARGDLDPARPGLRQQADDQGNAGAVDVVGAGEVEYHPAAERGSLVIAVLQRVLGGGVDVADQIDDG